MCNALLLFLSCPKSKETNERKKAIEKRKRGKVCDHFEIEHSVVNDFFIEVSFPTNAIPNEFMS